MKERKPPKEFGEAYTKNIFNIIILACISILLAVIITGFLGYNNTKNSLINKAKTKDIVFMVKSMASKIDGRISRAVETSCILARDPVIVEWVNGEEKDAQLGKLVLKKLNDVANSYDYSNLFMVGAKTKKYYFQENSNIKKNNKEFVVLSESNPEDKWFFDRIKIKKEVVLNVNYDRAMDDSFLFVNTFIGSIDNPAGICGVGLSLKDITKEFSEFKIGQSSSLWMVDEKGIIKLSDLSDNIGKNYEEFLPSDVIKQIGNQSIPGSENVKVSEYVDTNGKIIDYAFCKLSSSNWILYYQIPRSESISLIDSLKINMICTVILVLIFFMILFYITSKKIANPYKQAMLINIELEHKVSKRTQELKESNQKIIDSIEYAKRLQESILPMDKDMKRIFKDSFVIWRPRDIVGGDFFWIREIDNVIVLAVGDCTGHGVPGALMTMTVNAILHNIVNSVNKDDSSLIIKELHTQLKKTLNKYTNSKSIDDGLDIAIFCIIDNSILNFSGANIDLYIKNDKTVKLIKPQSKGVGYSYIELNDSLYGEIIKINEGDIFIVTTDGYIHQNGGIKNYPFGKKRFYSIINECDTIDLNSMKFVLEHSLKEYMNDAEQRDDITIFAFKVK